jgi:Holliday junction resolvasome RuvABC DNA-binding subunit
MFTVLKSFSGKVSGSKGHVIELKDKVAFDIIGSEIPEQVLDSKAIDEASLVLVSLGVNKNDALKLARECAKEDSTAEEIVSKALRRLGN